MSNPIKTDEGPMSALILQTLRKFAFISGLMCPLMSFAVDDKEVLFKQASSTLAAANTTQANMLSPNHYNKGTEHLQKAEALFAKNKPVDKIEIELTQSQNLLAQAIKNTELANVTFSSTLKARNDANGADAQTLANKDWRGAEETFLQAASKLETGNLKRAKSLAAKAEDLYRSAELAAIKSSYLDGAQTLIEKAYKEKVDHYAPKTLFNAEALLASAEKELTENRYDVDYPRSLAKQALFEAKHSLYLAGQVKELDQGKLTTEEFLLETEVPLIQIASALDIVANSDQSRDEVTKMLVGNIESLRAEAYELSERKKQLNRLEGDVASLEQKLGIQSKRIAEQETLEKVDNLFTPSEAKVLTEGRNILIRAVGLSFNPGSDTIDSKHYALLKKLQEATALYPQYSILIEGHTDAFGGDAANLNLSFSRAEAVKAYLDTNISTSAQIEAIGYGETRPIASNETAEGRQKNRRIDFMLRPPL